MPDVGGALLLTNHQSYLDPVLVGVRLRRPVAFLAKSELFEVTGLNWLIRSLNAFPVRQGAGDVGAIRETISRLNEGYILNVFPEGTRTLDGKMNEIQGGFALILRKVEVPAIPVIIHGSYQAWKPGTLLFKTVENPREIRSTDERERSEARADCRTNRSHFANHARRTARGGNEGTSWLTHWKNLQKLALQFREERNWKQFHNPKDVALSMSLEVGELMEIMQWKTGAELDEHLAKNREHVGQELSDILAWVLLFAADQGIDIGKAFREKLVHNAEKYPVEKAKGRAVKYDRLDET